MKYAIVVAFSDEDQGYIATVPELPGCSAFGDTEEDAIREVKIAASLWLSAAKKAGRKAPQPIVEKQFKGRFPLRLPGGPAPQTGAGGEKEGRLAQSVNPSKNRLTAAVLSGKANGCILVAPGCRLGCGGC
jgi:predicted RNase H-like HicB family nuclease